jgi:mannitol/fructose-specific phosphotransferase system IIA component
MAFLYGELEAPRRRELGAHLERCPECSAQVKAWRASKYDLDEWKLPFRRAAGRAWVPVVRWAAAAAVVLGMGIAVGRLMSPSAGEVAQLKASVAELSAAVHRGGGGGDSPATLAAATTAANAETLRLLTQYSALQASQRSADQLALKDVLDTFDVRLATLRNELETVAVNTEGGFQLTRQNLARLVSVQEPK